MVVALCDPILYAYLMEVVMTTANFLPDLTIPPVSSCGLLDELFKAYDADIIVLVGQLDEAHTLL